MTTKKQIIAHWSHKFKMSPENFENKGTSFFPRLHLNKHQRVIIFQTQKHSFIFYPDVHTKLFSRFGTSNELIGAKELNLYFSSLSLEQRGTDYYFYWMTDNPQYETAINMRLLQSSDQAALFSLQESVTNYEKKLGDINIEHPVVIGWFSDSKLLCVGSLIIEDEIADIGILTHPQARGKGIGKRVVRALIVEGLKINKIVQYTSMQKNTASVRLAKSLGFKRFATETYWNINVSHK